MSRLPGFLFLCACLSAHATSCAGIATVCSSFSASTVVFLGRLLEANPWPARCDRQTYPDGTSATGCWQPLPENFRFEVLEIFKGDPGPQITVTGSEQQFRKGEQYLVFATLNPATQATWTGACVDNHVVDSPNLDPDIKWLRAYPTAQLTATIFGKINWPFEAAAAGYKDADLPSVSIELTGEKDRTARTGADNRYSFEDLPPGTYKLTPAIPDGYALWSSQNTETVTIEAKGCAEVDWPIAHDTHIAGKVTDANGMPAFGAIVGLLRPSQNRVGFDEVESQHTDVNGHYDFSKAAPGAYWVAAYYRGPNNSEPYIPVYYPSGDRPSSAKLIHVGPRQRIEDINLALKPPLRLVSLHVRVVNPDGSPAIEANAIASDQLTPTQAMSGSADENGNVDLRLYDGREYRLIASTSGYRQPACAGPIKFTAKEGIRLGTLTLDKSWDRCRALQTAP